MRRSNFIHLLTASPSLMFMGDQVAAQGSGATGHYNIVDFGGDPTSAKDSSKALLQMLKAFRQEAKPILFPAGKFVFQDPNALIEVAHSKRTSGIYLRGAGIDKTTLVFNAPNKSAIRLVNDGNSQFSWGNYIGHLTIDGNNTANSRGLEMIGQWLSQIEFVRITKFGGAGIWFPDRSDLNRRWYGNSRKPEETSSDFWSTAFFVMENCFINRNSGWGIKNDAGSAWSSIDIRNTGILSNGLGGIYRPGPSFNFILGAIAYNSGPGVVIAKGLEYTSYGLFFDRVEFDRNRQPHVVLNAAQDAVFNGCRFIHEADSKNNFQTYPVCSVKIDTNSTAYKYDGVQNVKFINPKIRWDTTHNKSITIFDFSNSQNINLIDIERLELNAIIQSNSPVVLVDNLYAGLTHQRKAVSQNMSDHQIFYANPVHPLSAQL